MLQQPSMPRREQEKGEAQQVMEAALVAFAGLPKTGKPQPNEYTVLAGFAITWNADPAEDVRVGRVTAPAIVALGTGTKCLGGTHRNQHGDLINDSHAEAIARRALQRWLYAELAKCANLGAPSAGALFKRGPCGLWEKNGDWKLHMFVSQLPCGDACVPEQTEMPGPSLDAGGRLPRTGAKALPAHAGACTTVIVPPSAADVDPGDALQRVAVLRRKPGRGDATLSMSCSDKMARWSCLGVQGALLSTILAAPQYLSSITVALPQSGLPASALDVLQKSVVRAVSGRVESVADRMVYPYCLCAPAVHTLWLPGDRAEALGLADSHTRCIPSGVAINWSAGPSSGWQTALPYANTSRDAVHEVTLAASGRKAGTAKRGPAWTNPATRSSLCKAAMLQRYLSLFKSLNSPVPVRSDPVSSTSTASLQLPTLKLKPPDSSTFTREDESGQTLQQLNEMRVEALPPGNSPHERLSGVRMADVGFGSHVHADARTVTTSLENRNCEAPGLLGVTLHGSDLEFPDVEGLGTQQVARGLLRSEVTGYGPLKRSTEYARVWEALLQHPSPFQGWLLKPAHLEAFGLPHAEVGGAVGS